jgi:hypothetical protein
MVWNSIGPRSYLSYSPPFIIRIMPDRLSGSKYIIPWNP